MNRQKALEMLEPITRATVRSVEHTSRGRVTVGTESVSLRPGSGRAYDLAPDGTSKLLGFAGVPATVAKALRPNTLGQVLTECLARKEHYALVLEEGRITDFLKYGERHSIPAERALATIERTVPQADFQRVMLLPNHIASVEVVGIEERAVRPGDLIRAGTMVAFSPIGTVNPFVQSYALRLVCTNGVTTNDVIREFGYGEGADGNFWP